MQNPEKTQWEIDKEHLLRYRQEKLQIALGQNRRLSTKL